LHGEYKFSGLGIQIGCRVSIVGEQVCFPITNPDGCEGLSGLQGSDHLLADRGGAWVRDHHQAFVSIHVDYRPRVEALRSGQNIRNDAGYLYVWNLH